jgi:hypothetical protein
MPDLGRDGVDHLDAGGTRADDADALALEVHRRLGPAAGVVDLALERLLSRERILQRRRQHAAAGDEVAHRIGPDKSVRKIGRLVVTRPVRRSREKDRGPGHRGLVRR